MHPFSPFSPSRVAILSTFRYLKSRNKQLCSTAISLICEWLTACAIVLSLFLSFDFAQIFFVVCPHRSGTNLFNGSLINVVLLQFNGVFHWAHMICHCVCACVRCTRCLLAVYFALYALRMHFFSLEEEEKEEEKMQNYTCVHIAHMPFVLRVLSFLNNTVSFANSILRCCAFVWYALLLRGLSVLVYLCIHLFIFSTFVLSLFSLAPHILICFHLARAKTQ